MRPLLYFLIVAIFVLCSCDSQNRKLPQKSIKLSIIGKWHRFSFGNGYSEFEFDSVYAVFFNQKTGRFKLEYRIKNDSFKYIGSNYAAQFINYGDSVFFRGNDNTTATLYRFKEPVPFSSIPEEKDSLQFNTYVKGFDQRMLAAFKKAGIEFFDDPNEADTSYEQLLNNKTN